MRVIMRVILIWIALITLAGLLSAQQSIPDVDPSLWDELLKQFVNEKHRVDYARLKKDGALRLNEYIARLGQAGIRTLQLNEKKAVLLNAYNAFTVQWVVKNYPIASIWGTDSPFTEARQRLGGEMVSLDTIETQLRASGDLRIHGALVCAARSCRHSGGKRTWPTAWTSNSTTTFASG